MKIKRLIRDLFLNAWSRRRENHMTYFLPSLLILFVVFFTAKTSLLITDVLVEPLFGSVKSSNRILDIIILIIAILWVFLFIRKGKKQVKISLAFEGYALAFSFVYIFFRFFEHTKFDFVPFRIKSLSFLSLTDIALVPLLGLFSYYISYLLAYIRNEKIRSKRVNGFYTDSPVKLNSTNDHLGRLAYINDIKERILATDSPEHSFAIGIVGEWGSGKTTFLDNLYDNLKGETEIIQIKFNPWVTQETQNITAIFFSDLASRLSEYDESLKKEIHEYSSELLQAVDNNILDVIKSIFDFTSSTSDLHQQYIRINKTIQRLKKKVIIYVDDVDRLESKEVIEILRIIRNTANFGNIFFLVAFDKVYVTKSIVQGLMSSTENYLEKIFQLEYYLPLSPDRDVYKRLLYEELRKVLGEKGVAKLDEMESTKPTLFSNLVRPPVGDFILSFRDLKRYMNIFMLNYDRIKNNIYLPDYISICILRLKFPEVYKQLYYNKFKFLTTATDYSIFDTEVGELFIRFPDRDESKIESSALYSYVTEKQENLAIKKEDIEGVMDIFQSMFSIKNRSVYGVMQSPKKFLSISDSACFNRYFDFSMSGRVDQAEFDEILNSSLDEIRMKFSEWNSARMSATDLQIKLENTNKFDTREEFEKIIRAIVYYSNLSIPQNPNYTNSFNTVNFYEKLGGKENGNELIKRFFGNDKNEFKEFFRSLFSDTNGDRWSFIYDFSKQLIGEDQDDFVVKHQELKDLIRDGFIKAVENADSLTLDLMQFYNLAVRLFQSPGDGRDIIIPEGDGILMSEKLWPLIKKNIETFFIWNIGRTGPNGEFVLHRWPEVVYQKNEVFDAIVDSRKDEPAIDEYLQFKEAVKKAQHAINFDFKILPVR